MSVAYLQHNRPTLAEAVAQFGAAGGPSPVRVLPLLLTAGGHLADDDVGGSGCECACGKGDGDGGANGVVAQML